MPYLSEGTYKPEWAKSKAKNAAKLRSLLQQVTTPFATYSGAGVDVGVYKVSNEDSDFYFVHDIIGDDPDLIQYGVHVKHYEFTGLLQGKTCGQVSVFRNSNYDPALGLPKWIFENVLYPKYGNIVSDNTQSSKGRGFWGSRIMQALESGKHVYALELDESPRRLKVLKIDELHKPSDMSKYYSTDQDYPGYYWRFLIRE
jgi:hypothetical protein